MKKLLIALTLLPTIASGQTYGCYVQNYATYCSSLSVICSFNVALDNLNYGYTVANLCDKYGIALASWDSEEKRANYNADGWTQCIAERDYNLGGWQGTVSMLASQNGLVKRLRRACGTKCKRIK